MAKIDQEYNLLLQKILKDGSKYSDPNRKGINRIQIPTYTFEHDFEDGFPAITTKKLYWKGIVGELLWFLRGETNIKYLLDNGINIWNKDAYNNYLKILKSSHPDCKPIKYDEFLLSVKKDGNNGNNHLLKLGLGDLGRVYGAQWRRFRNKKSTFGNADLYGVDQISNLIKGLKEIPMGTKHIVTAWNPAELDDMALPPCHWSFEILVEPCSREEKILTPGIYHKFTLKWHQRSVDTFLGLPFNIASYALLAHIIGKLTNMKPKGIVGDLSNVHIYEPHLNAVNEQLSRSTNMFNSECELMDFSGFKMDMHGDIDQWLNSKGISDFKLTKHTEQPAIPAKMLPYNK